MGNREELKTSSVSKSKEFMGRGEERLASQVPVTRNYPSPLSREADRSGAGHGKGGPGPGDHKLSSAVSSQSNLEQGISLSRLQFFRD